MSSGATAYMEAVLAIQRQVMETQQAQLASAADIMERAVRNDARILLFGSGHSHMLAEEGHYRAGGLAAVVPILASGLMLHESAIASTAYERLIGVARPLLARYNPQLQDCIVIFSNSGVNAVPVEMAQAAHEIGMKVIAVVALTYAVRAPLSPLGARLSDIADVIIDNCGVPGDALVEVGAQGIKVGPSSTVVGAFILNALLAEVAMRLAADNPEMLPVYVSANMPNAKEHNQQLFNHYRGRNPHL